MSVERRDFLKSSVLAASAGLALDACAPESNQLIPILVPEEQFVPGVESWHRSVCLECPSACGIEVRKIDGRLVKVEGNPEHPTSRGGLCARGQALPQTMYHPDRVRAPLVREGARGEGRFREATWEEVVALVSTKLAGAVESDGLVSFVTGELTGQRRRMVSRFLRLFPSSRHLVHEPFPLGPIERAHGRATGHSALFDFELERAGYVLSIGAELLTGHVSPVRFARGLADLRQGRPGRRGKLAMASPRLCLTAANADEWIPVRPGGAMWFVLAVTKIVAETQSSLGSEEFGALLRELELDELVTRAGVERIHIARIARELLDHRPSCVIAGGSAMRSRNGLATALAVSHLNALLGAYTREGLIRFGVDPLLPETETAGKEETSDSTPSALSTALEELVEGESLAQVLMVSGTNPDYDLPPGFRFRERVDAVSTIVSFASILDETAALADFVLPESMSFERFEEATPRAAPVPTTGIASPLLAGSLYDTMSMPDALIAIAREMGYEQRLGSASYEQALRESLVSRSQSWTEALVRGGVWTNAEPSRAFATADGRYRFVTAPIRAATEDKLKVDVEVEVDGNLDARFELDLHVYPSATLGDGRSAHVPFLLELQDPVTGARWTNLAEVAAEDARARGIDNGDTVEIASEAGSVTVTALVTEAVMPGVVAVAAGYGHRRYGRFATGRGVNAYSLLDARSDEDGFLVAGTKVSLRRVEGSV